MQDSSAHIWGELKAALRNGPVHVYVRTVDRGELRAVALYYVEGWVKLIDNDGRGNEMWLNMDAIVTWSILK